MTVDRTPSMSDRPAARWAGVAWFALLAAWLLSAAALAADPIPQPLHAAAAPGHHDDLASRTIRLVQERRWTDVVSTCETAARKGTLSPDLHQKYDLAKIHCDIARRHTEVAYRTRLAGLSETEARRVYGEILSRIASHHVDAPNFARLVSRGCQAMDVAIDEPLFASLYAAQATPERRSLYREQVARVVSGRQIGSPIEAETIAAWVARIANSSLGVPPAVTIMEMAASAVGGLDEYSSFLTTGQLDDLYAQIEGNFVGLGVELKGSDDGLLVVHVIPSSPAERSGLRAGDHVVAIGSRPLAGLGVDEAAQLLQGPEGSIVTLAIVRGGDVARAVTVRREHVEVPSIEDVRMLEPSAGVAYLKLTSFQKTTAADLEAAMRRLDVAGMRSLVIDLRGNPGGLLSAAVDVADLFLARGLVVATRGRCPDEDFNYSATRSGTWRMPLVLVIDGDSASSSEIFAGAMRDHARATIVGTRSYGKGSIQGIFPLETAGVGLRLTTAKFFSPNGRPYSNVGVEPDLVVHSVARPIEGQAAVSTADPFLSTAVAAARRNVQRTVAQPASRPMSTR
ncbi:MAG: S41 family peptidase [Planctomycetia bacterium]